MGDGVIGQEELKQELRRLSEALEEQRRQAAEKERQLERYAADLREIFKAERARAEELHGSYVATVRALTNAVEARDAYTGKHAERVAAYGLELLRRVDPELAGDPQMEFGFLLHDVGKVAIPDGILHKPEPLGTTEEALMRRHPVIGWEILRGIPFLEDASQIVRYHHERFDGSGYPEGLKGEEIPLPARVFAVADALDAIITDRPYRPAATLAEARAAIAREAGGHFDPRVVQALEEVPDEVLERIGAEVA
jgi:HD-GYP domain-containing protein (c-di-GMP phosphodiesterase class II)